MPYTISNFIVASPPLFPVRAPSAPLKAGDFPQITGDGAGATRSGSRVPLAALLARASRRFAGHDDLCIESTRTAQRIGDQAAVLRSLEQLPCFDGVRAHGHGEC